MAMKQREQMMALILGGLGTILVLYWGYSKYQSMFDARQAQITTLTKDVSRMDLQVKQINRAIAKRTELEKRSLPTDLFAAQTLYQNWLLSLVKDKLTEPVITPRAAQGKPIGFEKLGFDVKGQGKLEAITRVLYDFYASNHLHRITLLDIKPDAKGGTMSLSMHVEPIILPGTDRKDKLASVSGNPLEYDNFAVYEKGIVGRNLFAEYTPPAATPPSGPKEPPLDLARLAFVTNIGHGSDQRRYVWIYERNTAKMNYLFEGDDFEIAGIKGKVKKVDVDNRTAQLEIDGKEVTVNQTKSLGDTLADLKK
jgi:hypothetical protein